MAWRAHIQQVLLGHHQFNHKKFENDSYEVLVHLQSIDDESFTKAANHCRPYYYSGHDKNKIKDFLKMIISKYDNKVAFLKKLEVYGTLTEFNIMIYTLIFKSCVSNRMINFYNPNHIVKLIALGMKHKEFVLITMDLYDAVHEVVDLKELCNVLWYLLTKTEEEDKILLYNYLTYFIPTTKRLFGNEGLQSIFKANLQQKKFVKMIQIHLILNGYEDNNINIYQYIRDDDPEIKSYVFKIICKVTKRLKRFTLTEVIFVMEYMKTGEPNVIKQYFPYFISHFVVLANTSIRMKAPKNCDFLKKLHMLCKYLLFSGDEEKITLGGCVYAEIYRVVCLGKLKTSYSLKPCDVYGSRENPIFMLCISNGDWAFGEPADIDMFFQKINMNNFSGFFNIFNALEFTEYMIDLQELYKIYENLLCKAILHMDEKMAIFINFFLTHYPSEIDNLFEKILNTTLLEPEVARIDYAHYSNFRAISIYITEKGDIIPDTKKADILQKAVGYLELLLSTHSPELKSHMENKFAEKMVAYCIDIILELYRITPYLTDEQLHGVIIVVNKGLTCNMRFAVTHVAETFRKFVQTKAIRHTDLFYTYLIHKVGTIATNMDTTSRLRRSTEFRLIIHSICCGIYTDKKREFLEGVIRYIISLHMTTNNVDVCVVILHCLQQLVEESSLKEYTIHFIEYIVLLCLHNIGNSNYRLSNATLLLFEAAINRILPSKHSHNNMCIIDVLEMFPQIHNLKHYLKWDRNDSEFVLQSKILFLQFLQRADNNNVFIYSNDIVLIPIVLNFLAESYNVATPYYMQFVVHATPHSTLPHLYDWLSTVIVEKLQFSDLQMTYTFMNAIELLLGKYEFFLKNNNIKYCQRHFNRITNEFKNFKFEHNIQQLKVTGLLELSADTVWVHNNPDFAIHNLDLDYCPDFLSQLLAKPEHQKLLCVKNLLNRILTLKEPKQHIKFLGIAVNLVLTLECDETANPVISAFITLFGKNKYYLPKDIVNIEGKELIFLSKHRTTTFLVFIVKIIEACKTIMSPKLEEYILYSYMVPGDIDIMRTVLSLLNITKNRVGVLLSFTFILILTPYEHNGILELELHRHYPKLTGNTFGDTISEILSREFLMEYFTCKDDIPQFYKRFRMILDCIEHNQLVVNDGDELAYQYNMCELSFSQLALNFVDK